MRAKASPSRKKSTSHATIRTSSKQLNAVADRCEAVALRQRVSCGLKTSHFKLNRFPTAGANQVVVVLGATDAIPSLTIVSGQSICFTLINHVGQCSIHRREAKLLPCGNKLRMQSLSRDKSWLETQALTNSNLLPGRSLLGHLLTANLAFVKAIALATM